MFTACSPQFILLLAVNFHCSPQLVLLLAVNVHCMLSTVYAPSSCKSSLLSTAYAPSNSGCSLLSTDNSLTGNVHCIPHHILWYKGKCPQLDLHNKPTMTPNIFNAGFIALRTEKKNEILTLKCWVQSHITTYFNVSNVGFAWQTNTDSKIFNAGLNAHALSNSYGSMLSTAHAMSNCNCWMLSTAHAISNCKCSMLSTAYAPSNCSCSQHMLFQTVKKFTALDSACFSNRKYSLLYLWWRKVSNVGFACKTNADTKSLQC